MPGEDRFSRRKLLLGGAAALGLGGVEIVWQGFSQQSSNTSLEATRSSLPDSLLRKRKTLYTNWRHAATVFSVAWSPDGPSIASGITDTMVQVWQAL